jgi:hypothetical protein
MDAWGLVNRLVRRWYVFIPVLLVAVAVVVLRTDPTSGDSYEVRGTFLVVPSLETEAINLYVSNVGPQLIATRVSGAEQRARFDEAGYNSTYTVSNERGSSFISVTVVDKSETQALETAAALGDEMRSILAAAQDDLGVPRDDQAQVRVVDPPTYAEQTSAAVRVLAVPLLIAGIFAVLVTLMVDQIAILLGSRTQRTWGIAQGRATADAEKGNGRRTPTTRLPRTARPLRQTSHPT